MCVRSGGFCVSERISSQILFKLTDDQDLPSPVTNRVKSLPRCIFEYSRKSLYFIMTEKRKYVDRAVVNNSHYYGIFH